MRVNNKKRTYKLTPVGKLTVGLVVLIVINITTQLYIRASNRAMHEELISINAEIESISADIQAMHEHASLVRLSTLDFIDVNFIETEILVTNYWNGDGSSGDITASGLSIDDFKVNADGMYTYNNKIVVATPNIERLDRPIYKGYNSHNLFDEITLTFNNVTYEAVVLDVCGKCYGVSNEDAQRYDIFTTDNVIGKVPGVLHE